MNTSRNRLRLFIFIWLICTILSSISVVLTFNIYIIIFYGVILFRGCSNLFTLNTHSISMRLLPIITIFFIWPIGLVYLISYLYLLNRHWPEQQEDILTQDRSEIILKIEPVMPIPGHFKKFWKKFYVIKNGTSYTGQEFSGAKIANTYQIVQMCCPDSVEQNIYEEAIKVQKIKIHVSTDDGSLLELYIYEKDMIKIQNQINNIAQEACDKVNSKRIFTYSKSK